LIVRDYCKIDPSRTRVEKNVLDLAEAFPLAALDVCSGEFAGAQLLMTHAAIAGRSATVIIG